MFMIGFLISKLEGLFFGVLIYNEGVGFFVFLVLGLLYGKVLKDIMSKVCFNNILFCVVVGCFCKC